MSDEAHALEHSLEVHLPFLQTVLDEFKLVPLAVGDAEADEVAAVLDALWGGPETLIVVSSDLSHYLTYAQAQRVDRATSDAILALRTDIDHEQACGATPVCGARARGARRKLTPQLVDLRNSGRHRRGQGPRGRLRVVRVLRAAMTECTNAGPVLLLPIARAAIARELGRALPAPEDAEWLHKPGASFVTLSQGERLRGCIGTLEAHRPLLEDVKANALGAAFRDPRFPPLAADELDRTSRGVAALGARDDRFRARAAGAVPAAPGIDGIVFEYGHHQSTFLPQVWEDLPDPAEFIATLKQKAGLPPDFWDPEVKLARYTVSKWSE